VNQAVESTTYNKQVFGLFWGRGTGVLILWGLFGYIALLNTPVLPRPTIYDNAIPCPEREASVLPKPTIVRKRTSHTLPKYYSEVVRYAHLEECVESERRLKKATIAPEIGHIYGSSEVVGLQSCINEPYNPLPTAGLPKEGT